MRRRFQPVSEDRVDLTPMIDIVFLLLIYFMVTTTIVKEEADLGVKLPSSMAAAPDTPLPEQHYIDILEDGTVLLNGMPTDNPGSTELPNLTRTLGQLKASSDRAGLNTLVIIQPTDETYQQSVVNVLTRSRPSASAPYPSVKAAKRSASLPPAPCSLPPTLRSTVKLGSPCGPARALTTFETAFPMMSRPVQFLLLGSSLLLLPALPAQTYIASEDEAHWEPYADDWQTGDNGGRGFGDWRLRAPLYLNENDEEQFAGFFIAHAEVEGDLAGTGVSGRAFGIYANGTGFEETVAFRNFQRPLEPDDVFSLRFHFAGFEQKFERDAADRSAVGIALRSGQSAESTADLLEGRAFVLAQLQGLSTYQILDAAGRTNTRVFVDPEGVEVGFTLRDDGRYDLQLLTLGDDIVHRFEGRPLNRPDRDEDAAAAEAPPAIRGFALFNLNGGRNNAYFSTLQVSRQERPLP